MTRTELIEDLSNHFYRVGEAKIASPNAEAFESKVYAIPVMDVQGDTVSILDFHFYVLGEDTETEEAYFKADCAPEYTKAISVKMTHATPDEPTKLIEATAESEAIEAEVLPN
jgi:hypothetical protein